MLTLKDGVRVGQLSAPALLAMLVAERIHDKFGVECVVTSAVRAPNPRSLHDEGHAFDLRWYPEASPSIAFMLGAALSDEYDVVPEPDAPGGAHIHVEFDPK